MRPPHPPQPQPPPPAGGQNQRASRLAGYCARNRRVPLSTGRPLPTATHTVRVAADGASLEVIAEPPGRTSTLTVGHRRRRRPRQLRLQ
jgi:hypothetical protein